MSCEKFRSFNALKSSYSSSCLRENACKFYFHCSAYACAASVSVFVGLRCAVRVEWRFSLVEVQRTTTETFISLVID
ncbi:Protein translocase subunit SecF [Trichinella pseudospiralis]